MSVYTALIELIAASHLTRSHWGQVDPLTNLH
jgi:hypothetical protein